MLAKCIQNIVLILFRRKLCNNTNTSMGSSPSNCKSSINVLKPLPLIVDSNISIDNSKEIKNNINKCNMCVDNTTKISENTCIHIFI